MLIGPACVRKYLKYAAGDSIPLYMPFGDNRLKELFTILQGTLSLCTYMAMYNWPFTYQQINSNPCMDLYNILSVRMCIVSTYALYGYGAVYLFDLMPLCATNGTWCSLLFTLFRVSCLT